MDLPLQLPAGADRTAALRCAAGTALILGATLLALAFVQRQFGGYDLSPIIDLVWRLRNGEVPGRDFILTFPVGFVALLRVAGLFGMHWTDLTLVNAAAVLAVWLFLCSYRREFLGVPRLAVASAAILVIALLYTNHLWHSALTQLWAIALVFATHVALRTPRPAATHLLRLALAAALVATAKQNVAPPLLLGTLGWVLVAGGAARLRLATALVGGVAGGLIMAMGMLGMSAADLAFTYTAVAGRARPGVEMLDVVFGSRVHQVLIAILLVQTGIALWLMRRDWRAQQRPYLLGCLLVAALPVVTDWDSKMNNMALPLFVLMLLFYQDTQAGLLSRLWPAPGSALPREAGASPHETPEPTVLFLLALVLAWAVWAGYGRERMGGVGPFFELPANERITGGYFDGLATGKRMATIVREIGIAVPVAQSGTPVPRVFFGPRIEFGYALLIRNHPS